MTNDEKLTELFSAHLGSDWMIEHAFLSPDGASRIVRFKRVSSPPASLYTVLVFPESCEKAARDGKLPAEVIQDIENAIHMEGGRIGR